MTEAQSFRSSSHAFSDDHLSDSLLQQIDCCAVESVGACKESKEKKEPFISFYWEWISLWSTVYRDWRRDAKLHSPPASFLIAWIKTWKADSYSGKSIILG